MDYKPAPRDTSGVKLPEDIRELTEMLAKPGSVEARSNPSSRTSSPAAAAMMNSADLVQTTLATAAIALFPAALVFWAFRHAKR